MAEPKDARGAAASLEALQVLDRLEIGPARLERRRLTAPYRVVRGGAESSVDLIYRYEEDVFDPEEPASRNLAAFLAAQVALNYGLFARRIVFHGPLDGVDQRFLAEMAENTAREIYVHKLLRPNPYLVGPATGLEAVRYERYSRAELEFAEPVDGTPQGWAVEPGRASVAASGGKDSLLSHGLLREMGYEPHALFVNESGRHWYTALNAFRALSRTEPETTTRVWTSSDRVFSFMLRQLPFVRPDFAEVRSDEYPIRLWTVEVFLAGLLPLVRKRGIGWLVVGDEHDTTRRTRHEGITHYDALYDQSRYFDERLTRYYRRKGWPLIQFSLLRQLSELLIQRTLAVRYPDLHALQVSCHSARLEGERALPCGKCEKCRRIVAMHLALGLDPGRLGYGDREVAACVEGLVAHGVHQEAAGTEHLAWLLRQRELLPAAAPGFPRARERPEVVSLRFHDQASPIDGLPREVRAPLFRILLQHAEGAVERSGRSWAAIDPLDPERLGHPYSFDAPRAKATSTGAAARGRATHVLGELSWPLARERLAETDTALLPVGAIEQHGPHLPLDLDAWDADYVCREVAKRCSAPKPLVLPLIPYGVSYHHEDFPGTLSISPETLSRMVYEIGTSAAKHGIRKLVIVNGHGGNAPALQLAAQTINRDARIFTCVDTGETSDADIGSLTETPNDAHAGEVETSTALATRPELVDMSRARRSVPRFSSEYLDFSSKRGVEWFAHTGRMSKTGILGDATKASREKGERYWQLIIGHLLAFVEQIKGMSLAEIHERRQ